MKRAAIMARVSSDEQATGYSLDSQMEQLKKYCEQRNIEVVYEFFEDASAKTFNRPAFEKFLKMAKSNKGFVDYFLFISWDRFSRNTTDAYMMIRTLKGMGIETQATTQPIDFSIPESKFLLAYYLTFPEVDNDRRSIKIKDGIRMAWKSGRWVSGAPKGYLNSRDALNKPLLIANPKLVPAITTMFELAATGMSQYRIREEIKDLGLVYSRNGIAIALRNPIYMGKLILPPGEDGTGAAIVDGVHEGIISEELFYQVQDRLNRKANKRIAPKNKKLRAEFPLRGILNCNKCDGLMTGSASTSKTGGKHFYYHCNNCGKERYPIAVINNELDSILELIKFKKNPTELFQIVLKKYLSDNGKSSQSEIEKAKKELEVVKKRLENLQMLFIDGKIETQEYNKLRAKFISETENLKSGIESNRDKSKGTIEEIRDAIDLFKDLPKALKSMEISDKHEILSSIFTEKLKFDGKNCRTPKSNKVLDLLLTIDKGSGENKKRDKLKKIGLSLCVDPERFELSSK
ncbi:MAG: recombinase family protein [Bacteroidota bacterium]